jgi:hypothetical protein
VIGGEGIGKRHCGRRIEGGGREKWDRWIRGRPGDLLVSLILLVDSWDLPIRPNVQRLFLHPPLISSLRVLSPL